MPPVQLNRSSAFRGRAWLTAGLGALSAVLLATACGGQNPTSGSGSPPSAAATTAGDIPDNQAYVSFTLPSGPFSIKVPEGWARKQDGSVVSFTDNLNTIRLEAVPSPTQPTVQSATATELPAIEKSMAHLSAGKVSTAQRAGGNAILISYQADSPADPVTGKTVRDSVQRYEFWRNGVEAIVVLSGPAAADNADPWHTVSDSFRWQ